MALADFGFETRGTCGLLWTCSFALWRQLNGDNNMKLIMTKNLSSFSSIGGKGCSFRSAAVLWSVVLAFLLAGIAVPAAANEPAAQAKEKEKERDVVAVFRLEGHVTEVPAEESFALFGVPGTSLKELVSRLRKAAEDPAVKAVVILPDSVSLGLGQVEELRGAM